MKANLLALMLCLALVVTPTSAGPMAAGPAYGMCQTSCNISFTTCCAAAGFTLVGVFTLGLGVTAALAACSALQGGCMAKCAATAVKPTF
jgi:hypothetical protein